VIHATFNRVVGIHEKVAFLSARASCPKSLLRSLQFWPVRSTCAVRPEQTPTRLAVCFFGAVQRSLRVTWPSIVSNLFIPLRRSMVGEFDVFVHAMATTHFYNTRTGEDSDAEPLDLAMFKPCAAAVTWQSAWDAAHAKPFVSASRRYNSALLDPKFTNGTLANIIRQAYSIQRVASLIRTREHNAWLKYTHILMARPDTAILTPVLWRPPPDGGIAVSAVNPSLGVPDRFAYGPADMMLRMMSERYRHLQRNLMTAWNPEIFLCKLLLSRRVPVHAIDTCVVRVRANGWLSEREFSGDPRADTDKSCFARGASPLELPSHPCPNADQLIRGFRSMRASAVEVSSAVRRRRWRT